MAFIATAAFVLLFGIVCFLWLQLFMKVLSPSEFTFLLRLLNCIFININR